MDEININDYSVEEMEELANPAAPTDEELEGLGMLEPLPDHLQEEQDNTQATPTEGEEPMDNEDQPEGERYEKLSLFGTVQDVVAAHGTEILRVLPKNFEPNYAPRTKAGEIVQGFTKYGLGMVGLFAGGEVVAGVSAASKIPALIKGASALQKVTGGAKFFKTGKTGLKALGVKGLNIATQGSLQGAILDTALTDPYEGRMADLFGETDNPLINYLQTDYEDSAMEAKFKTVLDGMVVGMGVNAAGEALAPITKPLMAKYLKNAKVIKNTDFKSEKAAAKVVNEMVEEQQALTKIADTNDLVTQVRNIKQEADETASDASQMIVDNIPTKDIENAQNILKTLDQGEDIFVHADGTWDIKVNNWDDAYKVSEEEYKRQLAEVDEMKASFDPNYNKGDLGIQHQDEAIKHTWTNRGWIGENEELTVKNANKIAKNYKDKFELDNNVKVEFVDGLTVDGVAKEGNTYQTEFLGKKNTRKTKAAKSKATDNKAELANLKELTQKLDTITRSKQGHFWKVSVASPMERAFRDVEESLNSIITEVKKNPEKADWKALEDKYTKVVNDLPEEAQTEAFDKFYKVMDVATNFAKNKSISKEPSELLPNIMISIDKNAKNPYATLRAELEHTRDIAKGEVPDQKVKHFSRYEGMNEAEVAPSYTYKKASGKAKALKEAEQTQPTEPQLTVDEQDIKALEDVEINIPEGKAGEVSVDIPEETATQLAKNTEAEGTVKESTTPRLDDGGVEREAQIASAKSVDDLTNVTLDTTEDLDKVLNKAIELDPEVSGTTFKAIAEDSDKFADELEALGLTDELQKAINMNDVKAMDQITRRAIAAQKLTSTALDKLAALGDNPPIEAAKPLIDLVEQIGKYTKETGSAFGRGLGARRFTKKAMATFGSLRMSELTQAGLKDLTDLLDVEIRKAFNLGFTRGGKMTPQQMKEEVYAGLFANKDNPFVQALGDSPELAEAFDKILTNILAKGKQPTAKELVNALETMATQHKYARVMDAVKLAETNEEKKGVIRKWCDDNGGVSSYFVHNLLSSGATLAKNVISGGVNTVYYPLKKIAASYMGGGSEMREEGINTLLNLTSNISEAWRLCKQAFLKGEGTFSTLKETMNTDVESNIKGLGDWQIDFNNLKAMFQHPIQTMQQFHSLMTRAMGASDEFMSQLNYRSIIRAKALTKANQWAKQTGVTDEKTIADVADSIFNKAFNSDGKPVDVEAFAEAKDILYQTPLKGEMYDPIIGEMTKVREQSLVTKAAQGINKFANDNVIAKIFFPFVKTGANILQMNLDHNIFYLACSPTQRRILASNTKEGAMLRSQAAMGMFSFGVGASLALTGRVTGSAPADPKERKALFETGWKPYSIRVGNKFVSYQGYEPIQTILGFAADSVNVYGAMTNPNDNQKWEKFTQQVMATVVNNFIDKAAFRTGLRQMAVLTSPEEGNVKNLERALAQTAQGFLPASSAIRNTSSLGTRDVTQPSSLYERMFNNYFNRGLGDYRRDVFGDRQDTTGLLLTNASSDHFDDPEYRELERLAEGGFNPSDISKELSGTKLKFVDFVNDETGRSLYDTMQEELSTLELGGKTLREAVRDTVEMDEYQILPDGFNTAEIKYSTKDETKINMLRDIFYDFNNAALEKVLYEQGDMFIDRKGRTVNEAQQEVQIKHDESLMTDLTNL